MYQRSTKARRLVRFYLCDKSDPVWTRVTLPEEKQTKYFVACHTEKVQMITYKCKRGIQFQIHSRILRCVYLLSVKWLFTRWPAASAESNDNSPASTVPHTTWANLVAFLPGCDVLAPWTPSICKDRSLKLNKTSISNLTNQPIVLCVHCLASFEYMSHLKVSRSVLNECWDPLLIYVPFELICDGTNL